MLLRSIAAWQPAQITLGVPPTCKPCLEARKQGSRSVIFSLVS